MKHVLTPRPPPRAATLVFLCSAILLLPLPARTWTEQESGRTIDAQYVSADADNVTMKRASDGKEFTIALARLSDEDRAFVDAARNPPPPPVIATPTPVPDFQVARDRFDDIPAIDAETLPVAGDANEKLVPLDAVLTAFMSERNVGALVFALSRNGELLGNKAFGYADAALKKPLPLNSRMRLASVSKPVASAALQHLFRDGSLKADDLVFDILALEAQAPPGLDPRWKKIKVEHLLFHMAGFDSKESGDPMFEQARIAKELRIRVDKLTFADMLKWRMTTPLDFEPGEKEAYSNFGYNVLVEVIEKISGKSYADYLKQTITREAGLNSLLPGATDPDHRAPGEIWYHYHPDMEREPKPFPFRMEVQPGSGALVCSAPDLCRFLEAYWISGQPRQPGQQFGYTFFGSMPGTTAVAVQQPGGINYAAILNRREKYPSTWHEELKTVIDTALEKIEW